MSKYIANGTVIRGIRICDNLPTSGVFSRLNALFESRVYISYWAGDWSYKIDIKLDYEKLAEDLIKKVEAYNAKKQKIDEQANLLVLIGCRSEDPPGHAQYHVEIEQYQGFYWTDSSTINGG